MKKKYALVLSGGAFNGAFQVGALNYLQEHWSIFEPNQIMKFDVVAGVSVGSLNGSLIAQERMDLLNALWHQVGENGVREIYTSDFIDTESNPDRAEIKLNLKPLADKLLPGFKPKINVLNLMFNKKKLIDDNLKLLKASLEENISSFKSLADNTPLKNKINEVINRDEITHCKYFCGFVSLDDGLYRSVEQSDFNSGEDFKNGVLASTVMPIVWAPVPEVGVLGHPVLNSVDGGIKNVSPLGDVIDAITDDPEDADYTIFIINTSSGDIEEKDMSKANIASIALRALASITINEIFNNDIKEFIRINDVLEQVHEQAPEITVYNYSFSNQCRTDKVLRRFRAIIIQPDTGVLGDSLMANRRLIDARLEHGRDKMKKALDLYVTGGGEIMQCIV